MKLDRLLVVEGVSGEIEVSFVDHSLHFGKFGLEELFKELIEAYNVRISSFGVDYHVMENIVNFTLEVFLIEFFNFTQRHFVAALGLPLIDLRTDRTSFEIFFLQAFGNLQLFHWNLIIFNYLRHD